ncbi:hypothetical protein RYX36_001197 [Vicia faba]
MRISYNSIPFRFFIIFTACLCVYFAIQKMKPSHSNESSNIDKLPNEDEVLKLFQQWKKQHGRVYNDLDEMSMKFATFVTNLKYITKTNAKRASPHSAVLGLTNFADWSFEEFKETYMTMKTDTTDIVNDGDVDKSPCSDPPSSVDWVAKGAVTPVMTQGSCDSCWAISVAGAIEGLVKITTNKLIGLSAQELVDCDKKSSGCAGGYRPNAFKWVIGNKGLALGSKYPYKTVKGDCKSSKIPVSASSNINAYKQVEQSDLGLLCAVAKQPISVGIYAATEDFQHYSHGIYEGPNCPVDSKTSTHAMLIVGYHSVDGQDYWIVKNSCGTEWGMAGYAYIKRNTGKKYGVCAINASAFRPFKNK